MNDYERETTRIDTEHVVPAQAATPLAPVTTGTRSCRSRRPCPYRGGAGCFCPGFARDDIAHYTTTRPTAVEMARRVIVLLFGILQALLVLRIILLLLGANPGNDIVQFILNVTSPFVDPFRDMFSLDRVRSSGTGSVLDVAAIVALIAWTLIEMLLLAIVNLFSTRRTTARILIPRRVGTASRPRFVEIARCYPPAGATRAGRRS